MKRLLKLAGRMSGVLKASDAGEVPGRGLRITATALVVSLLVWAGLPESVATPLLAFLRELVLQ